MGLNHRIVLTLGGTQTLAFASSYYLPAILAAPMGGDLGVSTATVFLGFSAGLLVAAFLGPRVGQRIDRQGGRPVLMFSNLAFAVALASLALAQGLWSMLAAWLLMGVAMACGFYEAGFATLVHWYGRHARPLITGITLVAGFASTVGWPLSTYLEWEFGWRGACAGWALLHLCVGLPLNWSLPQQGPVLPATSQTSQNVDGEGRAAMDGPGKGTTAPQVPLRSVVLLSTVFALTWFISTAMAAHLPTLLSTLGASASVVVLAGAMLGPAQVAGRLLEYGVLSRFHPLLSARLSSLLHPLAAVSLWVFGAPVAVVFAILHGAGNGVLTIAKGTLPLALFGPLGYGERQGWLMVPARLSQALAPWLFGLCVDIWGSGALVLSAGLAGLVALCLFLLRPTTDAARP